MTTPLEFLEIGKPMLNFLNMNFPIYDGKESRSDEKQHNNVQKDYEKKTTKNNQTNKSTNKRTVLCVALHFALGQNSDLLCLTGNYSLHVQLT